MTFFRDTWWIFARSMRQSLQQGSPDQHNDG